MIFCLVTAFKRDGKGCVFVTASMSDSSGSFFGNRVHE